MSSLTQALLIAILSINVWNAGSTNTPLFSFGSCPSLSAVENLDLTMFVTTWFHYQQTRSPFLISSVTSTCTKTEFSNVNGQNFNVQFSEQNPSKQTSGNAILFGSAGTQAKYTLTNFQNLPVTIFNFLRPHYDSNGDGNYWVLETDGANFAIVYGCESAFFYYKYEFLMVLTTAQQPDAATITAINTALSSAKFNDLSNAKNNLRTVTQNC